MPQNRPHSLIDRCAFESLPSRHRCDAFAALECCSVQQRQWLALHCSVQHQWLALQRCAAEPQPESTRKQRRTRPHSPPDRSALTNKLGGRVFFEPRDDAPPRKEWHRVLRGPLSVRIVAADLPSYATQAGVLPSVPDATNLAEAILEHTDWSAALGRLGGVRQRRVGATARARQMQATHDGGLGARGHLAAAAARARAAPAGGADARAAARRGGRRDSGHAARGWRPGRAPGAEAAHGPGPALPGVSAPRELRRGAGGTHSAR